MSFLKTRPRQGSPSPPRRRRWQRRGIAALAPVTALLIAACGSVGHAASSAPTRSSSRSTGSTTATTRPHTSTSTTPATSTTPTTRTAATASTSAAAPTAGGPCRSAQLQITERSFGAGRYARAALGHSSVVVLFTNTGQASCTLTGYPGVAGLNSAGAQVTQARRTPSGYMGGLSSATSTPPVVTLDPNQTASAIVEGTDVPSGSQTTCPTLAGLLVTAPNTTRSVRLPAAPGDCSGLQVHPVVSGDSGSQGG